MPWLPCVFYTEGDGRVMGIKGDRGCLSHLGEGDMARGGQMDGRVARQGNILLSLRDDHLFAYTFEGGTKSGRTWPCTSERAESPRNQNKVRRGESTEVLSLGFASCGRAIDYLWNDSKRKRKPSGAPRLVAWGMEAHSPQDRDPPSSKRRVFV